MGVMAIISAAVIGAATHGAATRPQSRPAPAFDQSAMAGEAVVGRASVVDGDTIDIRGQRFRLFGIDAPESSQSCEDASGASYPCGRRAAQALDRMVEGRTVSCVQRDTDRYGRTVAVCSAGGVDLNGWMARNGQAVAYTQYGADYAGDAAQARREGAGIWQGRFEEPSRYRQSRKGGYGGGYGQRSGY
jgi:endonuclease YncB( thermonuclease family)